MYKLAVHPVILGEGIPLFDKIQEKHRLKLNEAKGFKSGVTLLTYETDRTLNKY